MLALALILSLSSLQQGPPPLLLASAENDGGPATIEVQIPTVSPPPTSELPSLENPVIYLRGFYKSVRAGNYFEAAALLVIAFVAFLQWGGAKLHEKLPDELPPNPTISDRAWGALERFLWFWFDTKPGKILKLCLTAASAGVGGAWVLGEPITPELVKPIMLTTFTASTLFGWAKDFMEWRDRKRAETAIAKGGVVVVVPPPGGVS